MDDLWQQALADVVRSELALRGRTAKDAYTALGISSTAWQTYFKTRKRDIPSRVLLDLARYLRMPLSELSARAEAREAQLVAEDRTRMSPADEALSQMSPEARDAVEEMRRRMGPDEDEEPETGEAANG